MTTIATGDRRDPCDHSPFFFFFFNYTDHTAVLFRVISSCPSPSSNNMPINAKFDSSTSCFCIGKHTKISLHLLREKIYCDFKLPLRDPSSVSFRNQVYILLWLIYRAWRILCCSNSKIPNTAIGSFSRTTALSGRPCATPISFACHVHKGL